MTRKTLSNLLAVLSVTTAVVAGYGSVYAYAETMEVEVTGLRSAEGVVHVMVYDNAQAFAENSVSDLANYATQAITSEPLAISLNGMKPGTYAVVIHHDENANNTFEMEGELPLEGWGYSNNVGQTDTPSYDAAAFTFDADTLSQKVRIVYAN